jgi:hypothetical protein
MFYFFQKLVSSSKYFASRIGHFSHFREKNNLQSWRAGSLTATATCTTTATTTTTTAAAAAAAAITASQNKFRNLHNTCEPFKSDVVPLS